MASNYKYHSEVGEMVPMEANYTFPSQAIRANKTSIKYPPKELGVFNSSTLRTANIEFPADGYINFRESALQMDVEWRTPPSGASNPLGPIQPIPGTKVPLVQLQPGGAHNLISNLKVMYGSQPFEEIRDYHTIVRIVMESGLSPGYIASSLGVLEGNAVTKLRNVEPACRGLANGPAGVQQAVSLTAQAHYTPAEDTPDASTGAGRGHNIFYQDNYKNSASVPGTWPAVAQAGTDNVRPRQRGGYPSQINPGMVTGASVVASYLNQFLFGSDTEMQRFSSGDNTTEDGIVRNRRTYVINLLSGLLNIEKLFPAKWTAAQLKVQITFETEARAAMWFRKSDAAPTDDPRYEITNLAFITELVDFDSSYDSAIYLALQKQGIPIRFSSFHLHSTQLSGSRQTIQIHERSRSIRCAFTVIKDNITSAGNYYTDADTFFHNGSAYHYAYSAALHGATNGTDKGDLGYVGRLAYTTDGLDGTVKSFIAGDGALAKYSAPDGTNTNNSTYAYNKVYAEYTNVLLGGLLTFQWRVGGRYYPSQPVRCTGGGAEAMMELTQAFNSFGDMVSGNMQIDHHSWTSSHGGVGNKFIIAGEFETTTGGRGEMNGINAEEQNDIALELVWNRYGPVNKRADTFIYYDLLLIIRPGNDIDLIL